MGDLDRTLDPDRTLGATNDPAALKPAVSGAPKIPDFDRTGGSERTAGAFGDAPTVPPILTGHTPEPSSMEPSPETSEPTSPLPYGPFGTRYQILKLLGAGGMGAVYKAWDATLSIVVALKVILPEAISDPTVARDVERRFKRELLLARQVTHKNVVRIHDLGEIDGIKYITMPYLEGEDLLTILKRAGKLPIADALRIAREVVAGLAAAHEAGVVHRDLKPANIMIEGDHAIIMDFGIARSASAPSMSSPESAESSRERPDLTVSPTSTATAAMIGTVHYMAPEQAKGDDVDQRADIYAVGLILSDMLLGWQSRPGGARSLEELRRRIEQAPAGIRSADPNIPEATEQLISRCLQPNPSDRFETTAEFAAALDRLDDKGELRPIRRVFGLRTVTAGVALALVLAGGAWWYALNSIPPKQQEPVSVLIADFQNSTQDAAFDGVLEQAMTTAMEGASFINTFSRSTARREAKQLGAQKLNQDAARLVALRDGLNTVVSGEIVKRGTDYTVSVEAVDARGKQVARSQIKATKETLLASIPKLAQPIRKALGDRAASSKAEEGNTFTASSLEAAHIYTLGADAALAGNYKNAIQYYQQALALDPNLARAYSGTAVAYRNLGDFDKAEENFKIALSKPGLSQRERFRIRGGNYLSVGNYEKAVDEYNSLLEQFPADNVGHANIAIAYTHLRNLPKAVEEARKTAYKNVALRANIALFSLYGGKFEDATHEADEVIKLNPALEYGYLVKALAALADENADQAAAYYEQLGKSSARGASYRRKGLADIALFEGRTSDAVALLQEGIKADVTAGNQELLAEKQLGLAHALQLLGQRGPAIAAAEQALKYKAPETQFLATRVLVDAGQEARAREIAQQLSMLAKEQQAYGKLIEGEIALKKGDIPEATRLIEESQKLVDMWISRFDLGRADLAKKAFLEADSEFDACIRRRGEVTALGFEADPTYGYFPPVYYYAGLAKEGIGNSSEAAESFKKFLAIRAKATQDPLVADAKKHLSK